VSARHQSVNNGGTKRCPIESRQIGYLQRDRQKRELSEILSRGSVEVYMD